MKHFTTVTILHAVNPTFRAEVEQERVAVGSYVSDQSGEDAAHEAYHITNAPGEILKVSEKVLLKEAGLNGKRSLSVGDVVTVRDFAGRTKVFLCDSFGWKEI
jgi:hypothetical protein